ncbi:MAG: phosphoheptose isomerase [Euryarchaeota archaeon]|nr:phosphoheptose isomerase [Euryarchaeota archaeon]
MNQNNETFLAEYLKDLQKLSYSLNKDTLIQMSNKIIATAKSKGKIIIVGNGGSASIASHVSVDFLKSVGIRACTFNESSLITCFANDYGYENWVKEALKRNTFENDTLILISSSGESSNILNAAKYAINKKISTITFTGFKKNNSLMKLGHLNIWVDSLNYNYVEITHNQFLLMLVDLVRLNYKIEL